MVYLQLFWEFFKTGLFSVGGGMATVPFLSKMAAKTGWFTYQQLADMIAVGESTPGPIGVNMATYVGYMTGLKMYGSGGAAAGAVIATLGLVAPSVIVILLIAMILKKFRESVLVKSAFYGLRPASVGLIGAAGFEIMLLCFFGAESLVSLTEGITFDWKYPALAAVLLVLTRGISQTKKWHPIVFILFSAVVGILFKF